MIFFAILKDLAFCLLFIHHCFVSLNICGPSFFSNFVSFYIVSLICFFPSFVSPLVCCFIVSPNMFCRSCSKLNIADIVTKETSLLMTCHLLRSADQLHTVSLFSFYRSSYTFLLLVFSEFRNVLK